MVEVSLKNFTMFFCNNFQDFSSVTDCTAASQLAFTNSLAVTLGQSPSSFTSTCSYGYINVNSRRRRGRALQQVRADTFSRKVCMSKLFLPRPCDD